MQLLQPRPRRNKAMGVTLHGDTTKQLSLQYLVGEMKTGTCL